jgi:hypothetical protein
MVYLNRKWWSRCIALVEVARQRDGERYWARLRELNEAAITAGGVH